VRIIRAVAAVDPLVKISRNLAKKCDALSFAEPVTCTYNPLVYARKPHEDYLKKWGQGTKEVLLLGMNPGPFGMAQNGVPFGEIAHVRDWLKIEGKVGKPPEEHEKRPVVGWECERSEVSGRRLWGWAKATFGTPEKFFARFYVANYCPLVFMEGDSGKNRVPQKLKKAEREALFAVCDEALKKTVELMKPKYVVGVGKWSRGRAEKALEGVEGVTLGHVLHPSPANPAANKGWGDKAQEQLEELGISI